jgi:hypothetical protein
MAHLSAGRKVLNGSGQTVHKMSGRHGITGILQYWLCVKMPAAVRVHRRIERKVCQQISGWPRSCSCRNASKVQELDRITVVSITAFVPPGYACQQCPLCARSGRSQECLSDYLPDDDMHSETLISFFFRL